MGCREGAGAAQLSGPPLPWAGALQPPLQGAGLGGQQASQQRARG